MHVYKYVRSYIILHQHVSTTPVTIIRVSYNITLSIQTTVPKCMIKPFDITHFCTIICKYSQCVCVCVCVVLGI
jgi:hypothetical protein